MSIGAAIGGVASGVGSLVGGLNGSSASQQAADDQSQAQDQNIQSWQSLLPNLVSNTQSGAGLASSWDQAATNALYSGGAQAYGDISSSLPSWNDAYSNGVSALNNGIQAYDTAVNNVTNLNNPGVQTYNAGNSLVQNLLANPSSITNTPGYQFNYNQGLTSLDRGAAASGNLFSGGQQAAEQQYGQNYATNSLSQWMGYGTNAINAGQPSVNNVGNANMTAAQGIAGLNTSLAGLGTTVAGGITNVNNNLGSADLSTAQNVANSAYNQAGVVTGETNNINSLFTQYLNAITGASTNSGNAQAQGATNSASSLNSGITGVGNSVNSGMNNYLLQNALSGSGYNNTYSPVPAMAAGNTIVNSNLGYNPMAYFTSSTNPQQ